MPLISLAVGVRDGELRNILHNLWRVRHNPMDFSGSVESWIVPLIDVRTLLELHLEPGHAAPADWPRSYDQIARPPFRKKHSQWGSHNPKGLVDAGGSRHASRQTAGMQIFRLNQSACAGHSRTIKLIGRSANQTYLVVLAMYASVRPGKTMSAALLEDTFEELRGHAGLGLWLVGSKWRTAPHMNTP